MPEPNWQNKTIYTGDNLYVMRGMNSDSVDLVYLDPPFNSNKVYSAPIGSDAAGAAFKDTWTLSDVDMVEAGRLREESGAGLYKFIEAAQYAHSKGMRSYLTMMAVRLVEIQRILKPTGSIYLHCDPTASHYLKGIMDAIFGKQNFRNEIVWCYTGPSNSKKQFQRKHDVVLFYGMDDWRFYPDQIRVPYKAETPLHLSRGFGDRTQDEVVMLEEQLRKGKIPTDWWADGFLTNISAWKKERTGFPTQKPLALLRRIILASSKVDDVVFDPFCGCATALVAADGLQRQWVGIDLSSKAVDLLIDRIKEHQGLFKDITAAKDKPRRTDVDPELTAQEKKLYKGVLFVMQNQTCNGCGTRFQRLEDFEMDHKTPRIHGGTDHKHNFQLLCANCNRKKGKKSQEQFMAAMAETRGRRLAKNQDGPE